MFKNIENIIFIEAGGVVCAIEYQFHVTNGLIFKKNQLTEAVSKVKIIFCIPLKMQLFPTIIEIIVEIRLFI